VHSLATSRNAVREALKMLAQEGLVNREPGRGTVVTGRIVQIPTDQIVPVVDSNPSHMAPVKVEPLEQRVVPSTALIRSRLRVDDPEVLMIEQLATLDSVPIYVRAGYLSVDGAADVNAQRVVAQGRALTPMAVAFESLFGVPLGECETVIEARSCEERTSRLLEIPEGSPVLVRELLLTGQDGRPRDLSYTHYRADRVSLSLTSSVSPSLNEWL
jgi:GntR family transcriptional regulator